MRGFDLPLKIHQLIFVLSTFVIITPCCHAQTPKPGRWMTKFIQAEQHARNTGQTLVVHFYADWCGPCRTMERKVLNSGDVRQALSQGMVGVKVNADRNSGLMQRFGVRSLPTDVFLAPDGTVLEKSTGSTSKQDYLANLLRLRVSPVAAADRSNRRMPYAVPSNSPPKEIQITQVSMPVDSTSLTATEQNSVEPSAEAHRRSAAAETGIHDKSAQVAVTRSSSEPAHETTELKIGLDGYCPVSLTTGRQWKRGRKHLEYKFEGVRYLFHGADELRQFSSSPAQFAPVLRGCDAVTLAAHGRMVPGAVAFGARFRDRVYFFTTADNRKTFLANPREFAPPAARANLNRTTEADSES